MADTDRWAAFLQWEVAVVSRAGGAGRRYPHHRRGPAHRPSLTPPTTPSFPRQRESPSPRRNGGTIGGLHPTTRFELSTFIGGSTDATARAAWSVPQTWLDFKLIHYRPPSSFPGPRRGKPWLHRQGIRRMFAAQSGNTMMPLRGLYPHAERQRRSWWPVVAAAAFVALWLAWPAPAAGQGSEADVRRVASQLRCVVCDHQSVAESNAELAAPNAGRHPRTASRRAHRPRDHSVLRRAVWGYHPLRTAAARLLAARLVGAGYRPCSSARPAQSASGGGASAHSRPSQPRRRCPPLPRTPPPTIYRTSPLPMSPTTASD